ncbi:EAL domain-containing protein [Teredinibacter franksiae]|uniref:EAL domain-containing protein n=1 Tax=Teredinibacter franksiae TaxID=2761453 RepID=UPI001FE55D40|nr:EAL domain-containing protein [Teredinibacter franksiae]
MRYSCKKISLDDFGTGYSLLTYLKDSPLNTSKIDQAFVGSMESQQTSALVSSMIVIGRHMGLELVVDGVETQQQFENLKQMGCKIF